MNRDHDLEELWEVAETGRAFRSEDVSQLPLPARRYIRHAISHDTPLASAVRLTMHGEIRLKHTWARFDAEEVIRVHRGFVWHATVVIKGLPVTGSDRWVDGKGAVKWKLLGLIPLAKAGGPDVTRSAAGRAQIEGIWLPSSFLGPGLSWEDPYGRRSATRVRVGDEESRVELMIDETGRLQEAALLRWGTPDGVGTEFRLERFGCVVDEEATFDGHTIPSHVRVGWYLGTERFENEGEFFRAVIDEAVFR